MLRAASEEINVFSLNSYRKIPDFSEKRKVASGSFSEKNCPIRTDP
jgi:hypothetical protein